MIYTQTNRMNWLYTATPYTFNVHFNKRFSESSRGFIFYLIQAN